MLSMTVFQPTIVAPSYLLHVRRPTKEAAMERQGEEVHLNETEATGGVKAQGDPLAGPIDPESPLDPDDPQYGGPR